MGDYSEFCLGEVRVTQADAKGFTIHSDHDPKARNLWIPRGQVHLRSDMESDVGYGAKGVLTVTEWFALSRGLKKIM